MTARPRDNNHYNYLSTEQTRPNYTRPFCLAGRQLESHRRRSSTNGRHRTVGPLRLKSWFIRPSVRPSVRPAGWLANCKLQTSLLFLLISTKLCSSALAPPRLASLPHKPASRWAREQLAGVPLTLNLAPKLRAEFARSAGLHCFCKCYCCCYYSNWMSVQIERAQWASRMAGWLARWLAGQQVARWPTSWTWLGADRAQSGQLNMYEAKPNQRVKNLAHNVSCRAWIAPLPSLADSTRARPAGRLEQSKQPARRD